MSQLSPIEGHKMVSQLQKTCFINLAPSLKSLMFICVDYHFTFRTLHEGVVKLDACTCQVIICLRFKALLHYQDVTQDALMVTKSCVGL